jgi:hypothetical protein
MVSEVPKAWSHTSTINFASGCQTRRHDKQAKNASQRTHNNTRRHFWPKMFGREGAPLVHNPVLDFLLGDVKNERGENEEGIVTLGEIAAEMGFENRQVLAHPPPVVSSPLNGLVRGGLSFPWLSRFVDVQFDLSSLWTPVPLLHSSANPHGID